MNFFVIIFYLINCTFACATVRAQLLKLHSQCGGKNFVGPSQCEDGLYCYAKHEHYSQCLRSCPSGWLCDPLSRTTTVTAKPPHIELPSNFPNCKFRFGMGYKSSLSSDSYSFVDYVTIWIGTTSKEFGNGFNKYFHGKMLQICLQYQKQPVFYGYIIAAMARLEWGLQDCNVGTPNLCERGAEYLRFRRAEIVETYRQYAVESAKIVGTETEIVWLIEPDFWQYHGHNKKGDGPMTGVEMRQLYDDIAKAIKSAMPYSKIAWNISPWLSEDVMRKWWASFETSEHIDFTFTSGGKSTIHIPNIRPGVLTWKFLNDLTKRRVLIDTGYGVAGLSSGHSDEFDNPDNIRARILEGAVSISQANPKSDWNVTVDGLRHVLPSLCADDGSHIIFG